MSKQDSIPRFTGYVFDFEYELIKGTWIIELWNGAKLLVEKNF